MTPIEYVTTAAGAAAIVAVGNAIYQAIKGTGASTRGEDGPIRVKGGSVLIEGEDDWEPTTGGQDFKFKLKDNPALNFWSVRLILDGVPDGPFFGKTLDVVMEAGGSTTTTVCRAKGGIRVKQPGSLAIDSGNTRLLKHTGTDPFIRELRLRGGVSPRDFGPFTPQESKVLQVVLQPVK
jgi:hypothetical protein